MAYDKTYEALVFDTLEALDPQDGDDQLSYIDQLRRLQGVITQRVNQDGVALDATQENAVRQAVGRLEPRADDAQQDGTSMLRRLQTVVDVELSRWTSAMVQPPGPSGDTAVAEPQTVGPQE